LDSTQEVSILVENDTVSLSYLVTILFVIQSCFNSLFEDAASG